MEIKGLVGRKKDILEYVFKPFSEYFKITPNEDEVTYDIHFRSSAKYQFIFDKELETVVISIKGYAVVLNTSEFLTITII